jgi:hypothetical protein
MLIALAVLTFTFQDVQLSDGGGWEGWASIYADGSRDWEVQTFGGDTELFPELTYTPANSVWNWEEHIGVRLITSGNRFVWAYVWYTAWYYDTQDSLVALERHTAEAFHFPDTYLARAGAGRLHISGDRSLAVVIPEPGVLGLLGMGAALYWRRSRYR